MIGKIDIQRATRCPVYIDKQLFERDLHYTIHDIVRNTYRLDNHDYIAERMQECIEYHIKRLKEIASFNVAVYKEPASFRHELNIGIRWVYAGEHLYNHINFTVNQESLLEPPENYEHDCLAFVELVE